jgi:hypothetical protein
VKYGPVSLEGIGIVPGDTVIMNVVLYEWPADANDLALPCDLQIEIPVLTAFEMFIEH